MHLRRLSFKVFAVVLLAVSLSCSRTHEPVPTPIPAPNFTLEGLDGSVQSLSDYRGKVVLLAFWSPWCHECTIDLPVLNRIAARFSREDLVALGITVQAEKEKILQFRGDRRISFPLLRDRTGEVAQRFGVNEIPYVVILDRQGNFAQFPSAKSGLSARVVGEFQWDRQVVLDDLQRLVRTSSPTP